MCHSKLAAQLAREAQLALLQRRHRARSTTTRIRSTPATATLLSPTQQTGVCYEALACERVALTHTILGQAVRTPYGEIDIVAAAPTQLLFIEVRYRKHDNYGGALASVNRAKQQRIIRSAHYLLPQLWQQHFAQQGHTPSYRFDVIAYSGDSWQWIENAFA